MYPEDIQYLHTDTSLELEPNRKRLCEPVDSCEVRVMELPTTTRQDESVWDDSASCEDDEPPSSVKFSKVLLTSSSPTSHQQLVCDDSDGSTDDQPPSSVKFSKVLLTSSSPTSHQQLVCDDSDGSTDDQPPSSVKFSKVLLTSSSATSHQQLVCDNSDGSTDDQPPSSVKFSKVLLTSSSPTSHQQLVCDDSDGSTDDQPPSSVKFSKVLLTSSSSTSHQQLVCDDSDSSEDDLPLNNYSRPHTTKLETLPRRVRNDSGDVEDEASPTIKSCKVVLRRLATIPQPEVRCVYSDSSDDDDDVPLKIKYNQPRPVRNGCGSIDNEPTRTIKPCKVLLRKVATIPQPEVCIDSDSDRYTELTPRMKSCRVHLTKLTTSRLKSEWESSDYDETTSSEDSNYSDDCGSSDDEVPRRKFSKRQTTKVQTKPSQAKLRRHSLNERNGDDSDSNETISSEDSNNTDLDDESFDEETFGRDKAKNRCIIFNFPTHRQPILRFINEATVSELEVIRTMSAPKIEKILALRPFRHWEHMYNTFKKGNGFDSKKNLTTQLLGYCQEFLMSRDSMSKLINKCLAICKSLDKKIAARTGLCTQPSILNPQLKLADYQLVGLNWLQVLHQQKSNGILADEMGLGKTIQIIAFLAYLKETGNSRHPHLIIVPATILDNWHNEFAKWCPSMVVEKYFGSLEDRRSLRLKFRNTKMKGIDVVLTTYNTVHSTPDDRKLFQWTRIHYIVYDEAHMLKNMNSQRYSSLSMLRSEHVLLLTGTPLQNNLLELISLLCCVMPNVCDSKSEDVRSMLKTIFQSTARHKEKYVAKVGEPISPFERDLIAQTKLIMKPFVLRRLKVDVLESLPTKTDHTIKVKLTPTQMARYQEIVESYSLTKDCSAMTIMMDMRKLSNHPLLMRYYYDDKMVFDIAKQLSANHSYKKNAEPQYVFEELAPLSDFQLYQTIQKYKIDGFDLPEDLILESGKFNELDRMLPTLKLDGHRVLIFSQFVMMLDIIERYLDIRGHSYLRIDGSTVVDERQDLIDKYMTESNIFIFLLSTRAGGLGINLTEANTVIIHDIDFNPYNDKQAEDRCHRIGQTKPVTVHRLISEGTIEEGMYQMAIQKLNLEKEVTGENTSEDVQKRLVNLLTMALGLNREQLDIFLSSSKPLNAVEEF